MGNYESLRVDISVEDSVRPVDGEGKQGIDGAFVRVYEYVSKQLIEKVEEIEEELKKKDAAQSATAKKKG